MTKRRLDNDDFVNSLRQKHKEDPQLKQQAARNTFAMLMRAQQSPTTPTADPGPSYQYFNNSNTALPATVVCYKCSAAVAYDKCNHCEHLLCQTCLQQCNSCQYLYCSTCSNIDYSQSTDQVFCLSCAQG
ncbi:unnamed protein product [Mucor circinelloides]